LSNHPNVQNININSRKKSKGVFFKVHEKRI